ncbi:MAG TPA: phosphotransferase [Acidimicrobiales bacterium]|jgi:tRNA A-37 threonylcarbamoyl transferase component Bud32|nr:phosphotransferase [Acidimicrobiales bacterium]
MAGTPGRLIGSGRSADVYDLGDGRVLRRYRVARTAEFEAGVMAHVRAHGFPAPEVFDAAGPDLVMARVDGPTMLDDLARRPQTMPRHAAALARLHHRLHDVPPPEGVRRPFGPGGALLHLDLHPDNVILTADGPVLIDWPNVAVGPSEADVADTWILLATAATDKGSVVTRLGRRLFTAAFLRHCDKAAAARVLPAVADFRLGDRNVSADEAVRIKGLARRYRGPDGG